MASLKKTIRKNDFVSIGHKVVMINDTSKTEIDDHKKIKILEFFEKGCLLRVPFRSCAKGHMLTLFICSENEDVKLQGTMGKRKVSNSINMIGKVDRIDMERELGDEYSVILVNFIEYVKKEWASIIGSYADRQKEIFELFQKINR